MTIDELKDNRELMLEWRQILNNPVTQIVLNALIEAGPKGKTIYADISPTYAAIRLGHNAGYYDVFDALRQLAAEPVDNTPLEQTYANEPPPEIR